MIHFPPASGGHFPSDEKENHQQLSGTGRSVLVVGEDVQVAECPAHLPGCGVGGALVVAGEVEDFGDDAAGLGRGDRRFGGVC